MDFSARGKFSLKNTGETLPAGAPRSVTASFAWHQIGDRYRVEVWGALGQGRVQMTGDEQWMQLSRGDRALAAGPPAEVMRSNLGWSLPVATVPSWLRGEPLQAATPLATVSTEPLVRVLDEGGWRVEFSRYREPASALEEVGDGVDGAAPAAIVPGRITAVNDGRRITVVVREFLQ